MEKKESQAGRDGVESYESAKLCAQLILSFKGAITEGNHGGVPFPLDL